MPTSRSLKASARRSLASRKKLSDAAGEFRQLADAIRRGEVDAFVTEGSGGHQILVLQGLEAKRSEEQRNESDQITSAIRRGEVDAFITESAKGDQVLILQGAEHPYRILAESVNEGTATLDTKGTVLYANTRLAKMLGTTLKKLVGNPLQDHFSPRESRNLQSLLARGLRGTNRRDIVLASKSGKRRTVRFSFSMVDNAHVRNVCVIATELTALIEAKGALISNEESLRQLSSRLLRIQDEERRRIARDLHDITGQKLAMQSMGLAKVLKKSAEWDQDTRTTLFECADLTKQISEEIRTLSYMLHPPLLDELGLASCIKWYVEGFERRSGISVEVDAPRHFERLPADIELTFFRIVQESLTNVHRYSGSAKAYVRMKATHREIKVEIGDFGRGMRAGLLDDSSGTIAPVGVGIQGMKERMRQLSGNLEITSRLDKGTLVTATVPIPAVRSTNARPAALPTGGEGTQEQPVPASGARKRILIADDHETLRRGLRTMLQEQTEWEVCGEAVNGKEAVDQALKLSPDLIILDVNMPALDGLAVARRILDALPRTKILVFTVHDSVHIAKEIEAVGAHGYLPKSKAGEELLNMVRELLADNQVRSTVAGKTN